MRLGTLIGYDEAFLLSEGDGAVELGPADMLDRLRQKQGASGLSIR